MKITRGKIMNKLVKIYVELNSIIKDIDAGNSKWYIALWMMIIC